MVLALLAASYAINAADRQVFPVLLSSVTHAQNSHRVVGGADTLHNRNIILLLMT